MLAEVTGGRSRTRSAREGFGKPVPRRKDTRPLVGTGCYSDDVKPIPQCFVRRALPACRRAHPSQRYRRGARYAGLRPGIEARRAYGLVAP